MKRLLKRSDLILNLTTLLVIFFVISKGDSMEESNLPSNLKEISSSEKRNRLAGWNLKWVVQNVKSGIG